MCKEKGRRANPKHVTPMEQAFINARIKGKNYHQFHLLKRLRLEARGGVLSLTSLAAGEAVAAADIGAHTGASPESVSSLCATIHAALWMQAFPGAALLRIIERIDARETATKIHIYCADILFVVRLAASVMH